MVNKMFGKCKNLKVKNFEVMANMAACKHFMPVDDTTEKIKAVG